MKKKKIKIKSATRNKEQVPEHTSKTPENRRTFLNKIWKGLAILAGVEFTTVVFGYLFSSKGNKYTYTPKQLVEAGPVNTFEPNSVTVFRGGRFYLTRLEDGGFIALSLRCTHLGCSIEWEEDKKRFICPCHSSAFAMNGDVQNPPAPKALDYYPIIIEKGMIKVDVGTKLQRERFSKDQIVFV